METTTKNKRQFTGTVVSDKMTKTVVVRVDRTVLHPKYHKRYTRSTKMKAHDEKGEYHTGEMVVIEECKPLSRDKRWRVVARVTKGK
jgi:small subunit ribosomal protein S17